MSTSSEAVTPSPPTPDPPPRKLAGSPKSGQRGVALVATSDEMEPPPEPWITPEIVKGWVTSLGLHAILLLTLAFWYFSPKVSQQKKFDTRLAGTDSGVEDGQFDRGGLNTPITIPLGDPEPTPETAPLALKPTALEALEDKLKNFASDKPSAEGGLKNPNPGAGDGDGFGLARYGNGGEKIHGVEVKVGDPQFTLIWDSEADLDLHVIEPGGKEIYWEDRQGKQGGELDVDNTNGYGPENIYWLEPNEEGAKIKGQGPAGDYKWFVVYWGGFGGIDRETRWKVRIKHAGKVNVVSGKFRGKNERSKVHTIHIDGPERPRPTEADTE